LEGNPRVRIGNWVEERALMAVANQSRGSQTVAKNNTAIRIVGVPTTQNDYLTTAEISLQNTLKARHGPNYMKETQAPRRGDRREVERLAAAQAILAAKAAEEQEQKERELNEATFGGRNPQNRKRAIASTKSLEESKEANPLNGQAVRTVSNIGIPVRKVSEALICLPLVSCADFVSHSSSQGYPWPHTHRERRAHFLEEHDLFQADRGAHRTSAPMSRIAGGPRNKSLTVNIICT
jgi:hypothetical protein